MVVRYIRDSKNPIVHGNPTVVDKVISGFSANDYYELGTFAPQGKWDVFIDLTVTTEVAKYIFGCMDRANVVIGTQRTDTGKFRFVAYLGNTGTSWNIGTLYGEIINLASVQNQFIRVHFGFSGTSYIVEHSLDGGISYTGKGELQSTDKIAAANVLFGKAYTDSYAWPGSANLINTFVLDGDEIFFGHEIFIPKNQIISESKKQAQKYLAINGEPIYEKDTNSMKVGNGIDSYDDLPYLVDNSDKFIKPKDWIDIRSGSASNNVYFLVGHSADYTIYPQWSIKPTVSNSGTYDVYVDGIKQATTASGTETTLNWQTLALSSGWDVTYPTELHTHIVRITPTNNTNTFTKIEKHETTGTLWIHVNLPYACSYSFGNTGSNYHPALEAITSQNDELLISSAPSFVASLNVKLLPILIFDENTLNPNIAYAFYNSREITKLRIKNLKQDTYVSEPYTNTRNLTEIEAENCTFVMQSNMFRECRSLKKLPESIDYTARDFYEPAILRGAVALQNTMLDFSGNNIVKRLHITANAEYVGGVKGVVVSPNAPFNASTSPQLDVSYTGLNRGALVNLFNSMPTVTDSQVCNVTGATGAAALTASDLAIATNKGWTVTR